MEVKGYPALPCVNAAMDEAVCSSNILARLQEKSPTFSPTLYFYVNLLTTTRRHTEARTLLNLHVPIANLGTGARFSTALSIYFGKMLVRYLK